MNNFEEYLRLGEPNKAEKAKVWKMAIGLQQVDGLKSSDYLFFENLLAGQNHILKNHEMHVHYIDRVNTKNDPVKEVNDLVNDLVKRVRQLYIEYPKGATASHQLIWTH
jgi:hypothetical protein